MHDRHSPHRPVPTLWLLTDERQGAALWRALAHLPPASGVIVRHYSLPPAARARLFRKIRRIAHARRLHVLLAGEQALAVRWGADGSYGLNVRTSGRQKGFHAAPAHDRNEVRIAERKGAQMILLSPLYTTRSHPGAQPLGSRRFARLAAITRLPVIALGGVTRRSARKAQRLGAHGWAGIDAFI